MKKHRLQNLTRLLPSLGLTLMLLGAVACSEADNETADIADTKTNWLTSCESDNDCVSGLACECGVCTEICDQASDCSHLAEDAECSESAECNVQTCVRPEEGTDTSTSSEAGTPTSDEDTSTETGSTADDTADDTETSSADAGDTDATGTDTAPDSGLACPRDADEYLARGEQCALFDPIESCVVFYDDCGCGCEPEGAIDAGPACPRDADEYVLLGEQCQLWDPSESCTPFQDECGCGCEPGSADGGLECPRPSDEYAVLGEECQVWDPDPNCDYFIDACGCGCESETTTCELTEEELTAAGYIALGDDCDLVDPAPDCDFFRDECGCGCENVVDECEAPSGTDVETAGFDSPLSECFDAETLAGVVRSEEEYAAKLAQCGISDVESGVDFEADMLFFAVVEDRPTVSFTYAVLADDNKIHVGIEAGAYCGGAAPPAGIEIVRLPASETEVVQDTCFVGRCDGPPPP